MELILSMSNLKKSKGELSVSQHNRIFCKRAVEISFFALVITLFFLNQGHSQSDVFTTPAKQAILLDAQTGVTLYEHNSDELMVPSSMTKIMTVYMIFKRLHEGSLSLDDTFYVSEKAWRKGGSKMFVELGSRIKVKDLLLGIVVQSGNDACVVMSEGLAGTEEAFAVSMNRMAHEIGAKSVHFLNANGWPDEGHLCSTRDLAIIALRTVQDFPHLYKEFYSVSEFTYNKIRQQNLNPLLGVGIGGDGLKTGHTDAGGFGLVGSAIDKNGRRLVMVINGLPSKKARKEESIKLLQYGFRAFDSILIFRKGEIVSSGDVWLGDKPSIRLAANHDIWATIASHERDKLKVELVMKGPIQAPVKAGDPVAKLIITGSSLQKPFEVPLVAAEDVGKSGIFGRIKAAVLYLLLGHNPLESEEGTVRAKR